MKALIRRFARHPRAESAVLPAAWKTFDSGLAVNLDKRVFLRG